MEQRLCGIEYWSRGQRAEVDAQGVTPDHEEELYYGDIHTLEQMAQSGCGVSLNRDTQEPSGHNPISHVL